MKALQLYLIIVLFLCACDSPNNDPLKSKIVTTDIDHFWSAFDAAQPLFDPTSFQTFYLDKGTKGLEGFLDGRIQSAENLSTVVKSKSGYYASIRQSTASIASMEARIKDSFLKMKELYPKAVFPDIYFVIGALNSGGTTSGDGLIIGAEMYGLTPETPMDNLTDWEKTVLKPVEDLPHIVAHELIHFQQSYDGGSLLKACIKEGSADFIAELISGRHINQHVHEFANPRKKELWLEFRARMDKEDYQGWLYSQTEGRPNDLGYWMGYEITKSYYDNSSDKKKAIDEILNLKDEKVFLERSKLSESGFSGLSDLQD